MLLRKSSLLIFSVLSIFLFTLTTGPVNAKTSSKDIKPKTKPWASVGGFRSIKFGMNEKQVTRAISKEFKISKSQVKRKVHPTEQTTSLFTNIPNLLQTGGTARLGCILGQKSRKLIQVNVVWGYGVMENFKPEEIVAAANLLRDHFMKKRYQKDGLILNAQLNENTVLVFRGKDKKGRMIALTLITPVVKEGDKKKVLLNQTVLKLSYLVDPESPDILTIKEGDF